MNYPSKIIEEAVEIFAGLPGVGKRTALRYVLHLLKQPKENTEQLNLVIARLKSELKQCVNCFNITDKEICDICAGPNRDAQIICVVEDMRDVMAIENTGQFKGHYHVLGGIISPMDGVGPSDLTIEALVEKVSSGSVKEVIMALSTTMEGDTTNFYIFKRLKDSEITLTTLARGVAVGDELEFADEVTLGRSIMNRTPYEKSIKP